MTSLAAVCFVASTAVASITLVTENFDSYTGAVSSFSPPVFNFPATESLRVENGYASQGIVGALAFNGVQLVNWNSHSAPNCMMVRPGCAFRCNLEPRGGTNYVWDFWMLSAKTNDALAGYRISIVAEGADQNEQDFVIFRSGRNATTNGVTGAPNDNNSGIDGVDNIQAFNGIAGTVQANTWVTITNTGSGNRAYVTNGVWNHYRIVASTVTHTFAYYVNDMLTPVNAAVNCARPQELPVTAIRFANDGNGSTTGNYYTLIDDVSLTVDGNVVSLATGPITEGFESYPASNSGTVGSADSDPLGAWLTSETTGVGANAALNPIKVQVVDASVTAPHSGNNCLMVQAGQVAGASISWAQPTNEDVKITWWAKVPAAPLNNSVASVYLRVSLYANEAGNSSASDTILFGFGHRNAAPFGSQPTSILTFSRWFNEWFNNGSWGDTLQTYTADTWEEYQLTTHVSLNSYTLVKNPSGTPVIIVKDGQYISNWGNVKKFHTIGFSSSNGSGHPPAYIDDVKIEGYTNPEATEPRPYNISGAAPGNRFTNFTVLDVPGKLVGGVTVDPRDNNTILFTIDEDKIGEIRRATKVASGNWVVDPTPIVTGQYNPNTCIVGTNGTLWWVCDNVKGSTASALRRLKQPWATSQVEEVITDFGVGPPFKQDQPCDLTFFVTNGTTMLAVLDRGVNSDNNPNAIWIVDPNTTSLGQTAYTTSLAGPDNLLFGAGLTGNANGIATLPASGELVTVWEDGVSGTPLTTDDGVIMAFDTTTGAARQISTTGSGINWWAAGIAVDPVTGRIWISDRNNTTAPSAFLLPRICSFDPATVPAGSVNSSLVTELTFPNINPTADRGDRHINFKDPGMAFNTNGSLLVVSDQALCSGGGRLIVFHSEPFVVPPINLSIAQVNGCSHLTWTSGGAVSYVVQSTSSLSPAVAWTTISPTLLGTEYTDCSSAPKFYRVLATPQN